jgi:hypothetical protein
MKVQDTTSGIISDILKIPYYMWTLHGSKLNRDTIRRVVKGTKINKMKLTKKKKPKIDGILFSFLNYLGLSERKTCLKWCAHRKEQIGNITPPHFQLYYRAIVTKPAWSWHKK